MKPDWSQLLPDVWDAVIVGAGPAGSVAAALLAKRGWRVLLVEKSSWPRDKVCGGCLSAAAVDLLQEMGLESAVREAQRLHGINWRIGRQALRIPAPGGAALLRSDFDAALATSAIERGCEFVAGVSAKLLPAAVADYRTLELRSDADAINIQARVVLAGDGIAGKFLAAEPWAQWRIAPRAWMGVAATFSDWPSELSSGDIHMHIGAGGYVGLVRVGKAADGPVHLAAALDPNACRESGGPAELVRTILDSCGRFTPAASAHFHGTGLLTRRRCEFGGHRVLAIGDASGYVEPFTGEGMAWAMASARDAAAMLVESPNQWPADLAERWTAQQNMEIVRRQRLCRALLPMVHHPSIASAAIFLARAVPQLGKFAAHHTGHPFPPRIRQSFQGVQ